jgi:ABC-2 type transport system permease protein
MKHIWTIAKKELRSYFNSPLAYIFINVFLIITGWLFFQNYFLHGQADMRYFFGLVPWMFLFIVPAITMRVWAEEKKMGTIELLLTMPLRDHEVVLGKFLASFLFLAITLVLSFMIPVVVLWSGPADLGVILASYVGAMLMGAAYISLGVWLSSYTDNQIIAFILALITSFLFFIVGQVFVLQSIPSFLTGFFQFLGIGAHFDSISRGVIDSRDVLFYLSFIGFFLFLNVQQISSRRFK